MLNAVISISAASAKAGVGHNSKLPSGEIQHETDDSFQRRNAPFRFTYTYSSEPMYESLSIM